MEDLLPTVLVIDDEPLNRKVVRAALAREANVVEAASAAEGFAVLASNDVDLVLLDVLLPGENGFEACRRLKTRPGGYLPVLLLTALHDQEQRNEGLSSLADDFLTKPIDRRELVLRVRLFARLRQQDQALRHRAAEIERLAAFKDDLTSLLVHDLRNPLVGLFGFIELARDRAITDDDKEDIEMGVAAANRMRDLVNDLLQIRSLEVGELALVRSPVRLASVADTVVGLVGPAAKERALLLRRAGDAPADVDTALLQRAIENLVVNAIRYAPRGTEVEVNVTDYASRAVVSVLDRGPGVPDANKPMLFQRFGGVDDSARRARTGYGLGLYLVQLVARAHGGGVEVTDRAGGGACFTIDLPRAA